MSQESSGSKRKSLASLPSGTKVDKERWSQIQLAMGDSQHFLDLINGLNWEEGLSREAVDLVESTLATSHAKVLDGATSTADSTVSSTTDYGGLITVSMARHASEATASMCAFAIAIVNYQYLFEPYHIARERANKLRKDIAVLQHEVPADPSSHHSGVDHADLPGIEEEPEVSEELLATLREELISLQAQFDESVMEKYGLSKTCQDVSTKLKLAKSLLESLKGRQDSWMQKLEDLPSTEVLLVNCLVAASFTVYGGSLPAHTRMNFFNSLLSLCTSGTFSLEDKDLNKIVSAHTLPQFLLTQSESHHLSMETLPMDLNSLLSVCIITTPYLSSWPLIIDPLGVSHQWLHKKYEDKATFVSYEDPMFINVLIKAMNEGRTLVIMDIDVLKLANDGSMQNVLTCRNLLTKNSHNTIKILVEDREEKTSPDFRLYLVSCCTDITAVSTKLASQCTVVLFTPECDGLESLLVDKFLEIQNVKMFNEQRQLRQEIYGNICHTESLEAQLIQALNNKDELELETKIINKLLALNKSYEFAQENLLRGIQTLQEMKTSHLANLNVLVKRAAIIINIAFQMRHLKPVYRTSYSYVVNIFKEYVQQAGSRIQGDNALSKLTKYGHSYFEQGYLEKDRLVFSFLLAIEIETSQNRVSEVEREFILQPYPGSNYNVKGLANQIPNEEAPFINFGKKPFDWMNENQWQMLLMLSSHFDWLHPIIYGFGRDGKEMFWRTMCEGIVPETITDGIGQKLTLMQQLLIQLALRRERLSQFISAFATRVLGYRSLSAGQHEVQGITRSLPLRLTPLLLYCNDSHLPPMKIQQLARKHHVDVTFFTISGVETTEDIDILLEEMNKLKNQGQWVLLHNIHSSPTLLKALKAFSLSDGHQTRETRKGLVWLSMSSEYLDVPLPVLVQCMTVAVESPKLPFNSVTHSLNCVHQEQLMGCSPRTEWLPLLHSLAMLHLTISLRHSVCPWAFVTNYHWNNMHFLDSLYYIAQEFSVSDKPVSWNGIRFLLSEIVYGSVITSTTDAATLGAITEYWIHPGGPRREQGRYHIPSLFFTPGTKLNALLQSIESFPCPLVTSTELYGLHYTPEMILGWRDKILSNVIHLQSHLKLNISVSDILRQVSRPLIRRDVLASLQLVRNVHGTFSSAQQVTFIHMEKLPAFIQFPCNMLDFQLDSINPAILYPSLQSNMRITELQVVLLSTVNKLAESFVCGWKKDVLVEKLRRYNPESPFGRFMAQEAHSLNTCISDIMLDIKELQVALQPKAQGDAFLTLPRLAEVALAILTLKTPLAWQSMVGVSSPPPTWDLQEWLEDVVRRYSFMDRVLTWGMDKTPTYWLGAFYNPSALLSIVHQNSLHSVSSSPDQVMLIGELTSRDKDHIRDPPADGMFLYGVYLWGAHFEKTTNLDLHDTPPKSSTPSLLPVVHVTLRCPPPTITPQTQDTKAPFLYYCPCYSSRQAQEHPLFHLKLTSNDVQSGKWSLRNLLCTLRPF